MALDANAVTYLIRALQSPYAEPVGKTAPEEIALFRIYLYHDVPYASPTAQKQCMAIRDGRKHESHDRWLSSHVRPFGGDLDMTGTQSRVLDLLQVHRDPEDCTILVECERYGIDYLLTCDRDFIANLGSEARGVAVLRPTEFWRRLNITPGAAPRVVPMTGNPMRNAVWWQV